MHTRYYTNLIGIAFALLLLAAPFNAFAAISVDATSKGTGSSSSTFTHVVGSSATILVVVATAAGGGSQTIGTPTWNGANMTLAAQVNSSDGSSVAIYYITNPATGSHSVSISCFNSSSCSGGAISLLGSATVSPIGGTGSSISEAGSTVSATVTTQNASSYIIVGVTTPVNPGTYTPNDAETAWVSSTIGNSGTPQGGQGQGYVATNSGSMSISWNTPNAPIARALEAVEILPATSVTATPTSIVGLVSAWWAF